jgi:hypothetical protein
MGYDTTFEGEFIISPPLDKNQVAYVQAFNRQRHMRRDLRALRKLPNPVRTNVGLPLGDEGVFWIDDPDSHGIRGQNFKELPGLDPPERGPKGIDPRIQMPGIWCQWTCSDDGTRLYWDDGEKFYEYIAWLDWMIRQLFKRWRRELIGEVNWWGEEPSDFGIIEMRAGNMMWLSFGRTELAPAIKHSVHGAARSTRP